MQALALRLFQPFYSIGRFALLLKRAGASLDDIAIYRKNIVIQMGRIGLDSIPIVALAAAFSGAVTTVQTAYQLVSPVIPASIIGAVVVPSLTMELAAVVTAFILSGRVGARIAAELGTMRVTEQIDALEVMGLNSVGYLIVPRVVAGVLMFPILYVAACFVGVMGAFGAAMLTDVVSVGEFISGAQAHYDDFGPWFGLIKSLVFGFFITSISCYMGYYTEGGAEGVGKSTTRAAVTSCVVVLIADLVLAILLL
ncbi:MAG: ABC transporter permease [Bacteroidota bacterium]|nr:ABC transporter permease [Bacteroidota bacterium]MDE2835182.1 ABC transporter permease [Bacteroidota bacterium]MDE2955593.1 ABC transporter permease [Bacteroidota bacterium]